MPLCRACLPPPEHYCDGGRALVWEVENYVGYRKNSFANKVYSVVDKVFYHNGRNQLTKQVMSERCDAIENENEESTLTNVAHCS